MRSTKISSAGFTSPTTQDELFRPGTRLAFLFDKGLREGTFVRREGSRLVLADRGGTSIYERASMKELSITRSSRPALESDLEVGAQVAFLFGKELREGTFVRREGGRVVLADRSGTSIYDRDAMKDLSITRSSRPAREEDVRVGARVAFLFGEELREGFMRRDGSRLVLADRSGTSIYEEKRIQDLRVVG